MKKLLYIAVILLLMATGAYAGAQFSGGGTFTKEGVIQAMGDKPIMPPNYTVATLPTPVAAAVGALVWVTDGNSATDCLTGTGANNVLCMWDGSAWANASCSTPPPAWIGQTCPPKAISSP